MSNSSKFSEILIHWYLDNKRDLPWRNTTDPYIIWVSEIILQQTRVDQGLNYFLRFIEKFPDVASLAKAEESTVLKLWQGLGYYSRARNMHSSAKSIIKEHNGIFPSDYQSIRSLKGIGEYTASAIASFAFGLPYPVIDGNVNRVITRYFGIDLPIQSLIAKELIKKKTNLLFDKKQPDTFNQAIMEFGAIQCLPANPDCLNCPFSEECVAYNIGKVGEIPKRKSTSVKKDRYFNYAVLKFGEKLIVKKRIEKDIWQNMYDFPLIENEKIDSIFNIEDISGMVMEASPQLVANYISEWKTQLLSHQRIHVRFHEFNLLNAEMTLPEGWELTDVRKIMDYPVPKLIESYISGL